MPNARPMISWLLECREHERRLLLKMMDRLSECGYQVPGSKYWIKKIREEQHHEQHQTR
jgi:hypothetical protein